MCLLWCPSFTTWCHLKGFPHTTDGNSFIQWPHACLKMIILTEDVWVNDCLTKSLCNWNNAVVFSISLSFPTLTVTPEEKANHKLPLIQHGTSSVDFSCFLFCFCLFRIMPLLFTCVFKPHPFCRLIFCKYTSLAFSFQLILPVTLVQFCVA